MADNMQDEEILDRLEAEIERRLSERFAALRDEFDRLRLEADRRWVGFLERFEQDFSGIVPADMLAQRPAAPSKALGGMSLDESRTLDAASNQVEALHRFLEIAKRRASRIALLVSKGSSLGVWKAVGFSEHGLDDEAVRRVSLALSDSGALAKVMEGTPERLSKGNTVSGKLEAGDAVEAVLIPMVVKEKVSGAVYADVVPGEEKDFDPEGLALLTFLAGLVVDRLAARKLRPAPPLRPIPARSDRPAVEDDISDLGIPRPREVPLAPQPPAAAPPPSFASMPTPIVETPAAPPPPPPPVREPEPPPTLAAPPAPEPSTGWENVPSPSPSPKPSAAMESPAATVRMPEVAPPITPPVPAWKPDASAAAPASAGRRLAGPLARSEGDERRDEARRFAKLLVSEIKLYNERAVQEGREHGNLYERLKEDIDRSRQMYDERIPDDIRSNTNFFYEELVRTLADGRAESLGM
jgi:hypothetical protein